MAGLMVASVISEVAALVLDSPLWCHSAVVAQYHQDQLQKKQAASQKYISLASFKASAAVQLRYLFFWDGKAGNSVVQSTPPKLQM
jgi:hypothetical protein